MDKAELNALQNRMQAAGDRLTELRARVTEHYATLGPSDKIKAAVELADAEALYAELNRQCLEQS